MSGSGDSSASGVRVASAIAGRLRLRAVGVPGREHLAAVADAMGSWPEIRSAQLRSQSGSLVVSFDPAHASSVADRLRALGIEPTARAPAVHRDPATAIEGTVSAANRALAGRLEGTDLRTLVPLGLGLLAARRAMRADDRLADAPWYVLAWYASETFMKFHGGATTPDSVPGSKEQ